MGSALLYLAVLVTCIYLENNKPSVSGAPRSAKKERGGGGGTSKLTLTSNRAVDALKCEHMWEMQFAVVVLKV